MEWGTEGRKKLAICSAQGINLAARNSTMDSQFPLDSQYETPCFPPAKEDSHYLLFVWTPLMIKYKPKISEAS